MEHIWVQEVSFMVAIISGGRGGGGGDEEINFPEEATIILKIYKLKYCSQWLLLVEVNISCFVLPGQLLDLKMGFYSAAGISDMTNILATM